MVSWQPPSTSPHKQLTPGRLCKAARLQRWATLYSGEAAALGTWRQGQAVLHVGKRQAQGAGGGRTRVSASKQATSWLHTIECQKALPPLKCPWWPGPHTCSSTSAFCSPWHKAAATANTHTTACYDGSGGGGAGWLGGVKKVGWGVLMVEVSLCVATWST